MQHSAQRRQHSAQAIICGMSLIIMHISAHLVHIAAQTSHICLHIIEPRIMQLAVVWHISAQSSSMHIIAGVMAMPCYMQVVMVSMHMV